jgi:hypothetical protein
VDSEATDIVAVALGEEVGQGEYLCLVIGYLLGEEEAFSEDCGLAIAEGVAD